MADLVAFLSHRRGRYIDRSKFPDAVLNGMALDLFGLYKEVVTRGGFRCGQSAAAAGSSTACRRDELPTTRFQERTRRSRQSDAAYGMFQMLRLMLPCCAVWVALLQAW
jgi:hypothetical protein